MNQLVCDLSPSTGTVSEVSNASLTTSHGASCRCRQWRPTRTAEILTIDCYAEVRRWPGLRRWKLRLEDGKLPSPAGRGRPGVASPMEFFSKRYEEIDLQRRRLEGRPWQPADTNIGLQPIISDVSDSSFCSCRAPKRNGTFLCRWSQVPHGSFRFSC